MCLLVHSSPFIFLKLKIQVRMPRSIFAVCQGLPCVHIREHGVKKYVEEWMCVQCDAVLSVSITLAAMTLCGCWTAIKLIINNFKQ